MRTNPEAVALPVPTNQQTEAQRIKTVYEQRRATIPAYRYSYFNRPNLFLIQSRERALLAALGKHYTHDLRDSKILDVGCGTGNTLRNFLQYGASASNLFGIDLLEERVELAKQQSPGISICTGDASQLPFERGVFDLVSQFTVFTSILDPKIKQAIAREMLRVLKPEGTIIWYDFLVNNPSNPAVRGIRKREIAQLFTPCRMFLQRTTLAPPLVRWLASRSWVLCHLLERACVLNTHYLGLLQQSS